MTELHEPQFAEDMSELYEQIHAVVEKIVNEVEVTIFSSVGRSISYGTLESLGIDDGDIIEMIDSYIDDFSSCDDYPNIERIKSMFDVESYVNDTIDDNTITTAVYVILYMLIDKYEDSQDEYLVVNDEDISSYYKIPDSATYEKLNEEQRQAVVQDLLITPIQSSIHKMTTMAERFMGRAQIASENNGDDTLINSHKDTATVLLKCVDELINLCTNYSIDK